jgi:hypothetical protein
MSSRHVPKRLKLTRFITSNLLGGPLERPVGAWRVRSGHRLCDEEKVAVGSYVRFLLDCQNLRDESLE